MGGDWLTRNLFYTTSIVALVCWTGWNTYSIRVTNQRIDTVGASSETTSEDN
jgi:hypothetical protein